MENLTYIFNSTTRGQLVEFITAMAHAIEPNKTAISPLPFMISISGTANAGKSLFWDQIKDTRLNAPINDVARSREAENNGRIYETWSGTDKETAQSLSIFFCNTQAMYIMGEDHLGISAFRKAIATHSPLCYGPAQMEPQNSADNQQPRIKKIPEISGIFKSLLRDCLKHLLLRSGLFLRSSLFLCSWLLISVFFRRWLFLCRSFFLSWLCIFCVRVSR